MSEETVELKTGWYLSKAPQSEKFLVFEDFEKNIYYGINAHGDWLLGKGARKAHSMHLTTHEEAETRLSQFAIEMGYSKKQSECLSGKPSFKLIENELHRVIRKRNYSESRIIMKDGIWAAFAEEKKPSQTEIAKKQIEIIESAKSTLSENAEVYERPKKPVDTREELKIHLDFEKEMNCSRSIAEIYNECLEELKEKLIERDVVEIGIFERKVRHIVEENNRLLSLTARQQLEIEEQNEMLKKNNYLISQLKGSFYSIGAPLNDNVLKFNKDQLKWCLEVVELIDQLRGKK